MVSGRREGVLCGGGGCYGEVWYVARYLDYGDKEWKDKISVVLSTLKV